MTARQDYIHGLRALADMLEAHPDLCLPYHGSSQNSSLLIIPRGDERAEMAKWARALPGEKTKAVRDKYFDLYGRLHGLHLQLITLRDQVCRRVVTGTREVVKTVPDPAADVPMVEVSETVEDVEWVCDPVLGGAVDS